MRRIVGNTALIGLLYLAVWIMTELLYRPHDIKLRFGLIGAAVFSSIWFCWESSQFLRKATHKR